MSSSYIRSTARLSEVASIVLAAAVALIFSASAIAAETGKPELLSVKPKKYNIRLNMVDLFVGSYGAEGDIRLTDTITVGPSLAYIYAESGAVTLKAYRIGFRANWFRTGTWQTDGWYLGVFGQYNPVQATEEVANGRDKVSEECVFAGGLIYGRGWMWTSGMNIRIGAGFTYYKAPSTYDPSSNRSSVSLFWFAGILPTAEFSVGYSF
jgi:hypothetical protein